MLLTSLQPTSIVSLSIYSLHLQDLLCICIFNIFYLFISCFPRFGIFSYFHWIELFEQKRVLGRDCLDTKVLALQSNLENEYASYYYSYSLKVTIKVLHNCYLSLVWKIITYIFDICLFDFFWHVIWNFVRKLFFCRLQLPSKKNTFFKT